MFEPLKKELSHKAFNLYWLYIPDEDFNGWNTFLVLLCFYIQVKLKAFSIYPLECLIFLAWIYQLF